MPTSFPSSGPTSLAPLPGPRYSGTDPDLPVVVTGAGGFIGGWLVRDLLRQGVRTVRAVDVKPFDQWQQRFDEAENLRLDLKDLAACRRATESMAVVYNLAADMGGMGFIESHKAECMLSVLINTHMLVAARDARVQRYFYSSSACVYNAAKQEDADVTALVEDDAYPAMPEDGYGWEKLFSERMCRHFSEDYGLTTRIARFHNVYGPLGTYKDGREKAPAALSRKVAEAVLTGHPDIDIWGDGRQTRSFMFISDCVYGIQRLMWSGVAEPVNLGSSELVSIGELVSLLEEIAHVRLERNHDLSAPKGVRGRNSDNRLIYSLLGWAPGTPLREGMDVTYAWVRDQVAADLSTDAALQAWAG